jgi:hypothetical protein
MVLAWSLSLENHLRYTGDTIIIVGSMIATILVSVSVLDTLAESALSLPPVRLLLFAGGCVV